MKPVRDTRYGGRLLILASEVGPAVAGGDFEKDFVLAVGAGDDYATAAARFGISYEMAQYTVRRLIRRYEAMLKLAAGLEVLETRRGDLASAGLTGTQREALRMLLTGESQARVAGRLGITQAAVSSRLRLASRLLREVAITSGWARPLAEAVEVRRSRNTLTAFQRKARSGRSAEGKT